MKLLAATRIWLMRRATMLVIAAVSLGCAEKVPPKVIVFTSIDREVALPIFAKFTRETGIQVKAAYGVEPTQSMGLAREIVAQGAQSRCDLFWSDEIFGTLWLDREGLLRSFAAAGAGAFPTSTRSPHNTWYDVATDARVLVINTRQIAEAREPKSIQDLTDPQWYERTAIARPTNGASAIHAACIFQAWGDAKAKEFFLAVKRNARILATDREVAHAVATGSLAFGLTNSSDAAVELASAAPIKIIYPDQVDGQLGTLFIPSTVALLKNSPDVEAAEQLLSFLLSDEVAKRLTSPPGAFIPLRSDASALDGIKTPADVRTMSADFSAAAASWDATAKFLEAEFGAGD
jgi:iron(III) transport system substrate-binding protein